MSLMQDFREAFLVCAKTGVNAIFTCCKEAFYLQNSSPLLTFEIDSLAKKTVVQFAVLGVKTSSGEIS
jgi:4-hydroxy-tetrahydrodipicolinate reductase